MVCLIGSGLALFFVIPRSVTINEIGIVDYNVTINMNDSSAVLIMKVSKLKLIYLMRCEFQPYLHF